MMKWKRLFLFFSKSWSN